MKWQWLFSLFFLSLFCLGETPGTADHSTGVGANEQTQRAQADAKISDKEMAFLLKFDKPVESITARYGNQSKADLFLPNGITKALDSTSPDETVMANVLADLMGSRNETQIKTLREEASKIASEERTKGKEADNRYLTLVERTEWAAAILMKDPVKTIPEDPAKIDALKRFSEKFGSSMQEVNKRNEEVMRYIDLAKQGDETAKTWLRNNLDQKALMQFLKGQKETGGEKIFNDVVDAMSNLTADKKNKFLDISHTAGGSPTRLVFNQNPGNAGKVFDSFIKSAKPEDLSKSEVVFGKLSTNPTAENTRYWDGKTDKLVSGVPDGFLQPEVPVAKPNPTLPPAQTSQQSDANQAPPQNAANFEAFKKMVTASRCDTCHEAPQVTGTSLENARMLTHEGRTLKLRDFVRIASTGQMGAKVITPSQRQKLIEWAAFNK